MTGTQDAARLGAVRHRPEPKFTDLPMSLPQSPARDSRALPVDMNIGPTWVRVREPAHTTDAETCVPGLGTKRANGVAMHATEHVVRFYETDASLLDAVATFCADAIQADDVALVVATAEHRAGIAERLQARGLLEVAGSHDAYLALDAAATLSQVMI